MIDVVDLENCAREVMDETSKRALTVLNPLKTEATVTYDRQMVDGEGNTLVEFCETRVWSHRS